MNKQSEPQTPSRQERSVIVLRAFGYGCFDDWSDEPPGEREQRARGAVAALVSTILDSQRGGS
jgi:hypothetical protein